MKDNTPRYTPETVIKAVNGKIAHVPVTRVSAYPPLSHPEGCPIAPTFTAVELATPVGPRWYGVDKAYIDSSLRMVVQGFDARFEELAAWEIVS